MHVNLKLELFRTSFWRLFQDPHFGHQNLHVAVIENTVVFVYNLGTFSHTL